MNFFKGFLSLLMLLLSIGYCHAFENKVIITQTDGNVVKLDMIHGMTGHVATHVDRLADSKTSSYVYFFVASGAIDFDENGDAIPAVDPDSGEEGKVWFTVPVASLKDIDFDYDYAADVEKTLAPNVSVSVNAGKITLSGVEKPIEVIVSKLSGQLMLHTVYTTDSEIDLTLFGNDVYVIKVGNTTYKMLVRK